MEEGASKTSSHRQPMRDSPPAWGSGRRVTTQYKKLSTTPRRHTGEWRYSSMHTLTLALDGDEWPPSHPGCFTPTEIAPVPTGQEAGWDRM